MDDKVGKKDTRRDSGYVDCGIYKGWGKDIRLDVASSYGRIFQCPLDLDGTSCSVDGTEYFLVQLTQAPAVLLPACTEPV